MSLLAIAQEGQLAEEVVRTVLQGALSRHGSHKLFAAHAGISPVHISYIIHDSRMPKPKTAARMAQHLPLLPDERAEWLHYVDLYWDANMVISRHLPAIIRDDFARLVDDIWWTRFRAVTSADPIAARRLNLALIQLAARTLQYTVPPAHYLRYLNVMDVHQEVSATLGRRPDALWAARRMQWVAEVMTPDAPREDLIEQHIHRMNALRAEAVTLNNLQLNEQAYAKITQLESDPMYRHFHPWSPVVMWDKMNALARIRHSSLREAQKVWRAGMDVLIKHAEDWIEIGLLLLTRSYAEVAISHARFDEARELLDAYHQRRNDIYAFGAFYQVLFDQTYARLLWEQPRRDLTQWREFILRARNTATRAGYAQQLWEIQNTYGDALEQDAPASNNH